jgi:hypothetical protein
MVKRNGDFMNNKSYKLGFKRTGPALEDIKKELETKSNNTDGFITSDLKGVNPDLSEINIKNVEFTDDSDAVNHPSHYNKGGIEVIDFIMAWFAGDYCLGNVCKYIARSKHKGKELEDLKKAQWYLNKKINFLTNANK